MKISSAWTALNSPSPARAAAAPPQSRDSFQPSSVPQQQGFQPMGQSMPPMMGSGGLATGALMGAMVGGMGAGLMGVGALGIGSAFRQGLPTQTGTPPSGGTQSSTPPPTPVQTPPTPPVQPAQVKTPAPSIPANTGGFKLNWTMAETPEEKLVVKTAEAALAKLPPEVAANAVPAALIAMADGLGGPVGVMLAQVGRQMMKSVDCESAAKLGTIFLEQIENSAADSHKQRAQETLLSPMLQEQPLTQFSKVYSALNEIAQSRDMSEPTVPVGPEQPKTPQAIELKRVQDSLLGEIKPRWGATLDEKLAEALKGDGPMPKRAELSQEAFPGEWPQLQANMQSAIKDNMMLKFLDSKEQEAAISPSNWLKLTEGLGPNLTFGETFGVDKPEAPMTFAGANAAERKEREKLVNNLLRLETPAGAADGDLLRKTLNALDLSMLKDLNEAGYTITVTRQRVSNAETSLEGRLNTEGQTPALADMAEGAHVAEKDEDPRITVRTFWKEGRLQLEPGSVLREIGKAYDQVIGAKGGQPTHTNEELADAFKAEVKTADPRYQTQADFVADVFAKYQLDRERCSRQFPLTTKAFDHGIQGKYKTNGNLLAAMQKEQTGAPVVNVSGDPFGELKKIEDMNRVQFLTSKSMVPYTFELDSEKEHNVDALASSLGDALRDSRSPNNPRFQSDESLVHITADTFNKPGELQKVLDAQVQSGRGGFLYLDELDKITPQSPGFATLQNHFDRFGGQNPLMLQGTGADLDRLRPGLPTMLRKRFSTKTLTPQMTSEVVANTARSEGFSLSQEAKATVEKRAKDGGVTQANNLWQTIKSAQTVRNTKLMEYLEQTPQAGVRILSSDVNAAKLPKESDPFAEMEALIGLGNAKKELKSVLSQVKLQKQQEAHGLSTERPRLNLLFEGNPGTGKTTVAKLFSEALFKVGYLKNKKIVEVRVQDLVSGSPEENVKKLFENNKGGVLFVDEMHQLKDTDAGKRAFRAMIPYLGSKDYADTVFVGAGYKGEMRDLIRDVDDGAERRFSSVPFDDYTTAELGQILDKVAKDKDRVLDDPTRAAALARLETERRKMKHFGNAGSVTAMVETATKKQSVRLSNAPDSEALSKEQLMALSAEDFAEVKTVKPADVWKEIDALEGLEDVKSQLRDICTSIEFDKETGADPLQSFEPYFIIDGPPGTGKTTLARLLVKLMASYDIIPGADLVESQGADLQAGFVGQTTTKVSKLFESMWGQGGFIDEVGGLARAPEAFKADAVKTMLKEMEDNRGRFVLAVADYPDRINDFLAIDPGLARRFGHRFTLEAMTSSSALKALDKQIAGKGLQFSEGTAELLAEKMNALRNAPNWASGGDVRKLANSIIQQQKTGFMEAKKAGRNVTAKEITPEAIERGFATLMKEKGAAVSTAPRIKPDEPEPQIASMTQTQVAAKPQETSNEPINTADQALMAAQAAVDQAFAAQFINDPAEQARQEADVKSDYIKGIAEKLGIEPEAVMAQMAKTKIKVRKMVTMEVVTKAFEYHCPFCGGIDSGTCAYRGESLEWKIQHSLKKPWDVKTTETKMVDEEI